MSTLRSKLIKLAHSNPEVRKDLLPLLKREASSVNGMDPAKTYAELQRIILDSAGHMATLELLNGRLRDHEPVGTAEIVLQLDRVRQLDRVLDEFKPFREYLIDLRNMFRPR